MGRFLGECVRLVIGLGVLAEVLLPEHRNLEAFNYSLFEKLGRPPLAAGVALVAWGILAFLTIRKLARTAEKQGTT